MLYLLEIGCEDVIGGDGGVTVPEVPANKDAPVERPQRIAAAKARLRMREWAKDSTEPDRLTSYSLVNGGLLLFSYVI